MADECVACGMCLPSCPTYQQARTEAESPRGRIALVRGLATGQLQATEQVTDHLDACMMCRTCERICPAKVKFGKIMDESMHALSTTGHHEHSPQEKIMLRMLEDAGRLDRRFALLRVIDLLHFRGVARAALKWFSPALGKLLVRMPVTGMKMPFRERNPAIGKVKEPLMLFTGCVARHADRQSIDAAVQLLNRLGYEVNIPRGQQCCGAVHQHAGEQEEANKLLERNRRVFGQDANIPVIGLATGCTAHLQDLSEQYDQPGFPGSVVDICAFLSRDQNLPEMKFTEVPRKVLLHIPCSQRNVLRQESSVRTLLSLIPGLQVREIPSSISCCGAAGTYMFTHPEQANMQRKQILEEVNIVGEEILLTSNIGCAMHISQGLQQSGAEIRVMHPVQFVLESLLSE